MGRCDIKMTPTNREGLSWVRGAIIGIAASMGEDDKARRDVLRCAERVIESMLRDDEIESMLHDDEGEDHETQSD